MAERRMFAKSIIMSDKFMDLSAEAKNLYFCLCLSADDEGFTDTTRSVMTLLGCKIGAFNSLVKAGYVIKLSKDVSLIVHWNIHNSIRKDRKKESKFYEMKRLVAENPDGTYVLKNDLVDKRLTDDGQTVDKCPHSIGEVSIGKDRLDKGSVGKDSIGEDRIVKESVGKEEAPTPTETVFNEKEASCHKGTPAEIPFNEKVASLDNNTPTETAFNEKDASYHKNTPTGNVFKDNSLNIDSPTLTEIKDYCQRENLTYVNSEIFFNHYDAFSWCYPDGTRIKNWQALLKKWNAQDREKKGYVGRETFYGDSLYVDTSKLEA